MNTRSLILSIAASTLLVTGICCGTIETTEVMAPRRPVVPRGAPAKDQGTETPVESGDPYDVSYTSEPEHLHPGDVITFIFEVTQDGFPVGGLETSLSFEQTEGGSARGTVAMAEADPGIYSGKKPLIDAGDYQLTFTIKDDSREVSRVFNIHLESH